VEGLANSCALLDYLAEITAPGAFFLLDLGCSGGIDRPWRRMRRRLRAIGIDPDVREIERLRSREKNPAVSYENAFAGLPLNHPFLLQKQGRPQLERNPWPRLSTPRYMELVYSEDKPVTEKEKRSANLWPTAKLADPAVPLVVPEYLARCGIGSVDFLKIDVDGDDFEILHSFDQALADLKVLGVGIEVRFWGSHRETDGTFHNVDRFLKARGFELFNLTTRRYSAAALPGRFRARAPGATELGRVYQGDAMYARDLGSTDYDHNEDDHNHNKGAFVRSLSADKLLNLAAIFAVFDLPDCAADVVLKFRGPLSSVCDVDRVLNLLTAQAESRLGGPASYRRYMELFQQHPQQFLGTKNPFPGLARACKRNYLKWRGRRQLLALERRGE
jgi:hypothetical protein